MIVVKRNENYLAHHGRKGQQWGVRNGPPYPLDTKKAQKLVKSVQKQYSKNKKPIGQNKLITKAYQENGKRIRAAYYKAQTANQPLLEADNKLTKDFYDNYEDYKKQYLKKFPDEKEFIEIDGEHSSTMLDYFRDHNPYINKKDADAARKAFNDYHAETKQIVDELLGDYGDVKVHKLNNSVGTEVSTIVRNAFENIASFDYMRYKSNLNGMVDVDTMKNVFDTEDIMNRNAKKK